MTQSLKHIGYDDPITHKEFWSVNLKLNSEF